MFLKYLKKGGKNGTRNSVVIARCTVTDRHSPRALLALRKREMTSSEALGRPPLGQPVGVVGEATQSAVSWGAIFAGSVAAIAITIILMVLGSGIGLSM